MWQICDSAYDIIKAEKEKMKMKKELLKGLNERQIELVMNSKNPEELLKLAQEEDVELSEEQLAAVSGGGCSGDDKKDDNNKNDGHRKIES